MIKSDVGQLEWDAPIHTGVVFETLRKDIRDHCREFGGRSAALDRLMENFEVFAADYFSYFVNLLPEQYETETTHAELLSRILGKLNAEWTAIRLAAEQRSEDLYADDLASADRRAARYLAAFDGDREAVGGEAAPYVVTYFHKVPNIARFPYSEVPLIGLNLVASANDPASMAIAHEVGHHVYWRAPSSGRFSAMREMLAKALYSSLLDDFSEGLESDPDNLESYATRIKTWQGWREELFADIYGCLVAGPPYVWAAQKLFLGEVGDRGTLADDDGEHPCPYLRPLVQVEALRVMSKRYWNEGPRKVSTDLKELASLLEERWKLQCSALPCGSDQDGAEDVADVIHEETDLSLSALEDDIETVVKSILETKFPKVEGQPAVSLLYSVDLYGRTPEDIDAMAAFRATLEAETSPEYRPTPSGNGSPPSPLFQDLLDKIKSIVIETGSQEWQLLSNMQLSTTSHHSARKRHAFDAHETWHPKKWCKRHRH